MTRTTKHASKSVKTTVARVSKSARSRVKKASRAIAVPKQHLLREMMKKIKQMFKDSIAYLMKKEKQMLQRISKRITSIRSKVIPKPATLSLSR